MPSLALHDKCLQRHILPFLHLFTSEQELLKKFMPICNSPSAKYEHNIVGFVFNVANKAYEQIKKPPKGG